jgi:hypothetical protein
MKSRTHQPKAKLAEPASEFESRARQRLVGFDKDKAVAAILYLAKNLEISDKLTIAKALYFADKYHLNRYFRFILGDVYACMPRGPVPSDTYDLLKQGMEGQFEIHDHKIIPLAEPDMGEFSRSDIIALDYALEFCKGKSPDELSSISHDEVYDKNGSHLIDMSDFVENTENKDNLKKALMM